MNGGPEPALAVPKELLDLTREVWSKKLGRPLADGEAEGIIESFEPFCETVLDIWESEHDASSSVGSRQRRIAG